MKIVTLDVGLNKNLTVNKIYNVTDVDAVSGFIRDDLNNEIYVKTQGPCPTINNNHWIIIDPVKPETIYELLLIINELKSRFK